MRSKTSQPASGPARRDTKEGVPEGVPEHFFGDDGQVDMRKVTGVEALKYFGTQGIHFPVMNTRKGKS